MPQRIAHIEPRMQSEGNAMARFRVAATDYVFPDLEPEEEILAEVGAELIAGQAETRQDCVEIVTAERLAAGASTPNTSITCSASFQLAAVRGSTLPSWKLSL